MKRYVVRKYEDVREGMYFYAIEDRNGASWTCDCVDPDQKRNANRMCKILNQEESKQ